MLVSVVLPVYNAVEFIGESIQSILDQTYSNFELIIIDDGSTDGSDLLCKKYATLDQRVRYLSQSNMGIVTALNIGIDNAKGQLLCRMDADDISLSDRIEKQVLEFVRRKNLVLLGSQVLFTDFHRVSTLSNYPLNDKDCRERMVLGPCFAHPSVMIRMSIVNKYNIRYTDEYLYAEDYYMWVVLSSYGEVSNLNEVLLKYRVHNMQTSQMKSAVQTNSHVMISCKYMDQKYGLEVDQKEMKSFIFTPSMCRAGGLSVLLRILNCNFFSFKFKFRVFVRQLVKGFSNA